MAHHSHIVLALTVLYAAYCAVLLSNAAESCSNYDDGAFDPSMLWSIQQNSGIVGFPITIAQSNNDLVLQSVQVLFGANDGLTANFRIGVYDPNFNLITQSDQTAFTGTTENQIVTVPVTPATIAAVDTPMTVWVIQNCDTWEIRQWTSKYYSDVYISMAPNGQPNPSPATPFPATLQENAIHEEYNYIGLQLTVCQQANGGGDPAFRGFRGQLFTVKGEAGRVFSILGSSTFAFNSRFVALQHQNESMTATEMRAVRAAYKQQHGSGKHEKLLDRLRAHDSSASSTSLASSIPPATTAWSHPGPYMGECGLRLGEARLYVQPGDYETGFAAVTLDGIAVPISPAPISLDSNTTTVMRASAFKLHIETADVRFTIVNADHFINIEHARVKTLNAQLSGLLGQTNEPDWDVQPHDSQWKQHLETDYKLTTDDLFGGDVPGQQF